MQRSHANAQRGAAAHFLRSGRYHSIHDVSNCTHTCTAELTSLKWPRSSSSLTGTIRLFAFDSLRFPSLGENDSCAGRFLYKQRFN